MSGHSGYYPVELYPDKQEIEDLVNVKRKELGVIPELQ